MPSIIRSYKKIQRVSSVVVRAAERCFPKSEVSNVKCEYSYGEYSLELTVSLFEYESIDVEVSNVDVNKCSEQFIEKIKKSIGNIIKELKKEEQEIKNDIKEYGETYADSSMQYLSSALMFEQIICNITISK